jgi:hypothetical protein
MFGTSGINGTHRSFFVSDVAEKKKNPTLDTSWKNLFVF